MPLMTMIATMDRELAYKAVACRPRIKHCPSPHVGTICVVEGNSGWLPSTREGYPVTGSAPSGHLDNQRFIQSIDGKLEIGQDKAICVLGIACIEVPI